MLKSRFDGLKPYFTSKKRYINKEDLFVKVKNYKSEKKIINKKKLDGEGWFNMKKQLITKDVEKEIFKIRNRDFIDNKLTKIDDVDVYQVGEFVDE